MRRATVAHHRPRLCPQASVAESQMALPPERERFMSGLEIIFFSFIATIVVTSIVWMLWLSRNLER
jgi:hypothetical protein